MLDRNTRCSFAQLRALLVDLGFHFRVTSESNVIFELPEARTRLYLPPFSDSDSVDLVNLVIVARNLDERGILPRSEFEKLLRGEQVG